MVPQWSGWTLGWTSCPCACPDWTLDEPLDKCGLRPDHTFFLQEVKPVSPSSSEPAVMGFWVRRRPPCLTSTPCSGRNQGTCKLYVDEPLCIWPWTSCRCQPTPTPPGLASCRCQPTWGWTNRSKGDQGATFLFHWRVSKVRPSGHQGAHQNSVFFSHKHLQEAGVTFPQIRF